MVAPVHGNVAVVCPILGSSSGGSPSRSRGTCGEVHPTTWRAQGSLRTQRGSATPGLLHLLSQGASSEPTAKELEAHRAQLLRGPRVETSTEAEPSEQFMYAVKAFSGLALRSDPTYASMKPPPIDLVQGEKMEVPHALDRLPRRQRRCDRPHGRRSQHY